MDTARSEYRTSTSAVRDVSWTVRAAAARAERSLPTARGLRHQRPARPATAPGSRSPLNCPRRCSPDSPASRSRPPSHGTRELATTGRRSSRLGRPRQRLDAHKGCGAYERWESSTSDACGRTVGSWCGRAASRNHLLLLDHKPVWPQALAGDRGLPGLLKPESVLRRGATAPPC
jgi:hypothetical protein